MTNAYIALQRGGLQAGRVHWTRRRLLVGANSPKDALRICKQVGDKIACFPFCGDTTIKED